MASPRPMLLTNDQELLDDVLRLSAAADIEIEVVADLIAIRHRCRTAPLVMLGADRLEAMAGPRLIAGGRMYVLCRGQLTQDLVDRATALGIEDILALPRAEDILLDQLARAVDATEPAAVIGVVGGCGGAGASVLSGALAVAAARRGRDAMLVDLDPLGGGIDLLFGLEHEPGLRWADLGGSRGSVPATIRGSLPRYKGVAVLSHGRQPIMIPPETVDAIVDAGRRGGGVLVLDLPRQLGDWDKVDWADEIVVLAQTDIRGAVAAARLAADVRSSPAGVGLAVRRQSTGTLPTEAVANVVRLPLLGETRTEPTLATALGAGKPLRLRPGGPLSLLCDQLLDKLLPGGEAAA